MTISAMHGLMGALDLQVVLVQDKMTELTERQYALMDRSSQLEMNNLEMQQTQSDNVWVGASMQYTDDSGATYWNPDDPANGVDANGALRGGSPLSFAPGGATPYFEAGMTYADLGIPVFDPPATPGAQPAAVAGGGVVTQNDFFYEEVLPPVAPSTTPTRRLIRIPHTQVRFDRQRGHFVDPRSGQIAFQMGRRPRPAGATSPLAANRYSGRMVYIPKGRAQAQNKGQRDMIKKEELMITNLMKKLQTKLEMLQKQIDQVRGWLKKRVEDWFKGIGDQR